jgi:CheY-like chemotaxis protein
MVDYRPRDEDLNAADEEEAVLKDLRILVVDDSLDNQSLFGIYLSRAGASVTMADDGSQAVVLANKSAFDVVLMDIQMPNVDGYEATKILRESGFKMPIIALTAHAMDEEKKRVRLSGFSDFLSKPVRREALLAMILKHIPRFPQ